MVSNFSGCCQNFVVPSSVAQVSPLGIKKLVIFWWIMLGLYVALLLRCGSNKTSHLTLYNNDDHIFSLSFPHYRYKVCFWRAIQSLERGRIFFFYFSKNLYLQLWWETYRETIYKMATDSVLINEGNPIKAGNSDWGSGFWPKEEYSEGCQKSNFIGIRVGNMDLTMGDLQGPCGSLSCLVMAKGRTVGWILMHEWKETNTRDPPTFNSKKMLLPDIWE